MIPLVNPTKKIVVGIDFGTSYSGFGWILRDDPNKECFVRNDWQEQPTKYEKNKTAILYSKAKKPLCIGWEAIKKADQNTILLQGFKMQLMCNNPIQQGGVSFTVDEVVQDFLSLFREDLMIFLRSKIIHGPITNEDIQWVFGVPSIFRDVHKAKLRKIICAAGYVSEKNANSEKSLMIVTEPEAGAVCCIHKVKQENEPNSVNLREGDTYIVIDAGGGSVDLTSHKVNSLGKLEELTIQSGGELGATLFDKIFRKTLYSVFGNLEEFLNKDPREDAALMSNWEQTKQRVEDLIEKRRVQLPAGLLRYFNENPPNVTEETARSYRTTGCFNLDSTMLQNIFQENCSKICDLVREQINKMDTEYGKYPKYIFLVGGLGKNQVLRKMLVDELNKLGGNKTLSSMPTSQSLIIIPTELTTLVIPAWTGEAVLRGCALLGTDPSFIRTRKSKFTIGIEANEEFNSDIHSDEDCVLEGGIFLVKSVFQPFVRINESVPFNHEIVKEYVIPPNCTQLKIQLLKSHLPNPRNANKDKIDKWAVITVGCPLSSTKQKVTVRMLFGKSEINVTAETPDGNPQNIQLDFEEK